MSILEGDVVCEIVREDEAVAVTVCDPDCVFTADTLVESEASDVKLGESEVLLVKVISSVTVLNCERVELAEVVGE